jgi:hypothetical protein
MSLALETESNSVRPAADFTDPVVALAVLRNRAPARFFAGAGDPAVAIALLDRCPGQLADEWDTGDALHLARAYAVRGESHFAEACVSALATEVRTERPSGPPFPTTAGRDAALRLIRSCWALMLVRDAPAVSGAWAVEVLSTIGATATQLHRAVAQHRPSSPTHVTSEALALLYAGAVFREFAHSAAWRDAAVRRLIAESDLQVTPDGVHVEQSSWFHRFTVDVYLHFLALAARNNIPVPPSVALVVQRMVEFLLAIRQPDGSIPPIGDRDGTPLLPLVPRGTADARDTFALAAALFARGDFAWAAEGPAPEVGWLLGSAGIHAFDVLRPAPPASSRSRVFPSGGYAVMGTGWERDAHQMLIDVGSLGCAASSGHGHSDVLAIHCAVFGHPAIVDPGTHTYSGDSKWRDHFRSTMAHSTVTIDGVSQAEPSGPFGWRRRPRVQLREWHSTPEIDFLDAEHDGYTRLPDPVRHRRRVIFVKPAFWILIDDLAGRARHQIDLAFQFAPGTSGGPGTRSAAPPFQSPHVALGPHPWARVSTSSGQVLWTSAFPSAPAQPTLKCGALSPICGWTAPEFGCLRPAPMLIYSFAVALPWRIVTLLLPDRQATATPPSVRPIYDSGGLPNGFVFERPRRTVRFDDHAVIVERD